MNKTQPTRRQIKDLIKEARWTPSTKAMAFVVEDWLFKTNDWPGVDRLAYEAGMSKPTAIKELKTIEADLPVLITKSNGRTNVYSILEFTSSEELEAFFAEKAAWADCRDYYLSSVLEALLASLKGRVNGSTPVNSVLPVNTALPVKIEGGDRSTMLYRTGKTSLTHTKDKNKITLPGPGPAARDPQAALRERFEIWWKAYLAIILPQRRRKTNKERAFAEWCKLSEEEQADALAAVEPYGLDNQGEEQRYVMYPANWLKDRMFRSYAEEAQAARAEKIKLAAELYAGRRPYDAFLQAQLGPLEGEEGCRLDKGFFEEAKLLARTLRELGTSNVVHLHG